MVAMSKICVGLTVPVGVAALLVQADDTNQDGDQVSVSDSVSDDKSGNVGRSRFSFDDSSSTEAGITTMCSISDWEATSQALHANGSTLPCMGDGYNELFMACRSGDVGVVKRLFENNEKLDINAAIRSRYNAETLCPAAFDEFENMKKRYGYLYAPGCTPLHLSCYHGHVLLVKELLSHQEIEPNKSNDKHTSLHVACHHNRSEIVRLLLSHPKINVNTPDYVGSAPLHDACKFGHLQIVELLLKRKGIDVNTTSSGRYTPLMMASSHGHLNIVRCLLNHPKIDAKKATLGGQTAAMLANQRQANNNSPNNNEIVQLLKKHERRSCIIC